MKNFEQQLLKSSSSCVFHVASHQEVTGFRRVGNLEAFPVAGPAHPSTLQRTLLLFLPFCAFF